VRDIMTSHVIAATSLDTSDGCMQVMTEHRIRHLPVVDGDEVVGMISIGDLVKAVIEDQRAELDSLQRYIAS
jgi:CBS domain-containing protein